MEDATHKSTKVCYRKDCIVHSTNRVHQEKKRRKLSSSQHTFEKMMSSTSSVDQEDRGISEIHFADTAELPLFSRFYQSLKANPKTAWIAFLLKSPYFWTFLQIAGLILYFAVGIVFYGKNQGWGVGTTMFYTVVTMSTVGMWFLSLIYSSFVNLIMVLKATVIITLQMINPVYLRSFIFSLGFISSLSWLQKIWFKF